MPPRHNPALSLAQLDSTAPAHLSPATQAQYANWWDHMLKQPATSFVHFPVLMQTVVWLHRQHGLDGAMLVFLSGLAEMQILAEMLQMEGLLDMDVLQVHSQLDPEDHRRAFAPPRPGVRKVRLADESTSLPCLFGNGGCACNRDLGGAAV